MRQNHSYTAKDFHVGQEVVLMMAAGNGHYAPVRHNSQENPDHPCRGTVTKVGRKLIYISTIGADWKVDPTSDSRPYMVFSVKEAKERYCKFLEETKPKWQTQADIDQYVNEL